MIQKVKKFLRNFNEKRWQAKLRDRNKNSDFTLITNNCVGGIIYHNLGLQFQSPTINLYIKGEEYLEFVKHFEMYTKMNLKEIKEDGISFPIGILQDPTDESVLPIRVYFQHYKSFDDAKNRWEDRVKRINYSKLYAIWEFYDELYEIKLLKEFDNLDIKHKIIIHKPIKGFDTAFVFDETPIKAGKILEYDGLSGKRKLDRFDYVSFLNE